MKKLILLFCICCCEFIITSAQNSIDSVDIEDFKIPSTPGFALLDISPTIIQRPSNPKQFAFSLLNFTSNNGTLPKDFAVEATPYWFFKLKNETFYKYSSVYDGEQNNTFSGILRKMSFSLSTHFNDSGKNFLPRTNYASLGVRTTLLTIWGKNQTKELKLYLDEYKSVARGVAAENMTAQEKADKMEALNQAKEEVKSFSEIKPAFQVDVAYATADMFVENKYANRKFYKDAFWLNATLNTAVSNSGRLYFIGYGRLARENLLMDTTAGVFEKDANYDYGIKLEYEQDKFSLGLEHIQRKYKNRSEYDGKRTVLVIQYKVDKNLILYCTYGKNFPEQNNLFTLFGLNWSIGKSHLSTNPD